MTTFPSPFKLTKSCWSPPGRSLDVSFPSLEKNFSMSMLYSPELHSKLLSSSNSVRIPTATGTIDGGTGGERGALLISTLLLDSSPLFARLLVSSTLVFPTLLYSNLTNLCSDESILRRIYPLTTLFSYKSKLLRMESLTNLRAA